MTIVCPSCYKEKVTDGVCGTFNKLCDTCFDSIISGGQDLTQHEEEKHPTPIRVKIIAASLSFVCGFALGYLTGFLL